MVDKKDKKPASKETAKAAAKAKPKTKAKAAAKKNTVEEAAVDVEVQEYCTVRLFACGHGVVDGPVGEAWREDERARLILPADFDRPRQRPARNALADQLNDLLKQ